MPIPKNYKKKKSGSLPNLSSLSDKKPEISKEDLEKAEAKKRQAEEEEAKRRQKEEDDKKQAEEAHKQAVERKKKLQEAQELQRKQEEEEQAALKAEKEEAEQTNDDSESDGKFVQLTDKQVLDEDAADELEENTTNQYTQDKQDDINEQPKNNLPKKKKFLSKKKKSGKTDNRFEKGTDTLVENGSDYIDKKKKKIIPFGGNKSRPKKDKKFHGAQRYDERKDLSPFVKWIRFLTMIFCMIVIGLGIKNTFFQHIPNSDEIAAIAANVSGDTSYPKVRAQALAEQFASAYLEIDGGNQNNTSLNYFYTGSNSTNGDNSSQNTPTVGTSTNQKVVIQPKTFDVAVANGTSATFFEAAEVTNLEGKTTNSTGDNLTKWVGLAINILYDKSNDSLKISQDSPSLIPTYKITSDSSTQSATPNLGTGQSADDSVFSAMSPTLKGFLTAYANSTSTNHSQVDQYVKNNDNTVYSGFGGQAKLAVTSSGFTGTVYPVSSSKTNNTWKVDMQLAWSDTGNSGNHSVSYNGRYILTVIKINGKYFVQKINPYTYSGQAQQ